ncbi:MAG TPA: PQQ-binding-like beta-propeller repeat protein, partial [Candidatus Acidoferrales bacterium]|nr:PQQ-binding-like beta-propeller repeat protein [Candidatus Acidoferrales bacterium]
DAVFAGFAGAGNGSWRAFRAQDGTQLWAHAGDARVDPSSAYFGDRLLIAAGETVAALRAADGVALWRAQIPAARETSSPVVRDGTLFVSATPARTVAIDPDTGRTRWSAPYGSAGCTPAVAQRLVFVEDRTAVAALDERTGAVRWRVAIPEGIRSSVGSKATAAAGAYDGGVLFQSIPGNSTVAAFRAADGHVEWSVRTSAPVKMSGAIAGGDLYVGDTIGVVYRIDERTGGVRAALPFDQPYSASPPLVLGTTLVVGDGIYLRAISQKTFQ